MAEWEPYTRKIEKEWDALRSLARSRPGLFWSLLITALVILTWFAYDNFWAIPTLKEHLEARDTQIQELKDQLAAKDTEIQRLETQLAPFRALALQRYPGDESEALAKLSGDVADLQRKLEKAVSTIRSFSAVMTVRVSANWTNGKPPSSPAVMVFGQDPDLTIEMALRSGIRKELALQIAGVAQLTADGSDLLIEYKADAPPKSWILGTDSREIEGYGCIKGFMYGISRSKVTDNKVRVKDLAIELFINGQSHYTLDEEIGGTVELPEEEGTPRFQLTPSELLKPS